MRVLVGVESVEGAIEVSGWLHRLALGDVDEEWMHVLPAQKGMAWALDPLLATDQPGRLQEQAVRAMQLALQERSGDVPVEVRVGDPATELLRRAEETKADLIAVRGTNKGLLSELLLGSVARALIEGAPRSVLLTRGAPPASPLKAVVSTDHSAYLEKALERFVGWAPRGIGQLLLLHVSSPASPTASPPTADVAAALGTKLGLPAEAIRSRTATGSVFPAIQVALDETGADLLVLGAKGHTLLESLTLGSVSLRAVTTCKRSVLVLRV